MTCKVTITNESDPNSVNNHVLEITGGAGDKHVIGPRQSATTHVWIGAPIGITELDEVDGRGNSGYGALPPE